MRVGSERGLDSDRRAEAKWRMPTRLLPLVLLLLGPGLAGAQPVDPALFQELSWRPIGPFRGGRVLAVAGVPGEPAHFYFGAVNGGVWETHDAGRTWQPIFDSQPIGTIGAIAVAPSDSKVLYVGSGEADMRSSIAEGNGMYRSADGGQTWTRIGLDDTQQIGRILVDPEDPDRVYVAALGHPYGPNVERGVFRTTDGGRTWQKILFEDADTGAIDLAMKPGDPRVIYAALWQTRRPPWNVYPPSSGPGSGLYRSADGGDTWSRIDGNGMPVVHGRIGLATSRARPSRVYAMVDAEAGGVYRSDDGGDHWVRTCGDERLWQRGWYFGGLAVDPHDPDVVYVLNTNMFRSVDGGRSFSLVKGSPGGDDYHELWIDPVDPDRQILGADQGAVVTLDGGKTWSSWYNQPIAQLYRVATDNRFPYRVYGAQQDSGAASVPSRTTSFDGINMTQFREVTAGGESHNIAPDPRDPDLVYGGTVEKLDLRTMQTRSVDPTLAHVDRYRTTWTLPLAFSRRDPRVLYFANQRLFRTEDGGEHWAVISPDLTREDPGVPPNLDPATAAMSPEAGPRRGVIYAIAPSRVADGDIWVGTDDGLVWRTRDEGAHWTDVTPAALTPWSKVGILEASPFDAESAYAAIDRHRLDDFRPYVYRTRDGGKTWSLAVSGIPSDEAVNVVRADPLRKGLLFAGTERGIHVSFDDGEHWQSLQANLPVTSVRDIEVHGDDLVIATHGRGFWILDDIAPLRQATEAAGPAWLYRPSTAYRVRGDVWEGTPLPKDEPMAKNPPSGAFVDYVLQQTPRDPVVLEILDGAGELVRRYSSADAQAAFDPARTIVAPEWFRTRPRVASTPGMHRFVWTLRYPLPSALGGANVFGNEDTTKLKDGLWAPPGRYTVALVVDGKRLTQPLTVAPDPRVGIAPEAYREQFELGRQVERLRARVTVGMRETIALTGRLAERRKNASGDVAVRMAELEAKAWDLAGSAPAANRYNGWWRRAKSEATWRFVAEALDRLSAAVEAADAAPSPDARAGVAQLEPRVGVVEQAWSSLKAGDLARLDAELEALGQPPIER
jgi:photosystem II stability/assembly factor-like uncharacterized protein